jgi:hypothetical protein
MKYSDEDVAKIAEDVLEYSYLTDVIIDFFDKVNFQKPACNAINFRDALFHYIKLYDGFLEKDDEVFYGEKSSIREHLDRGVKDSLILLICNIRDKIKANININKGSKKRMLRQHYHFFSNMVLEIRLNGTDISRINNNIVNQIEKRIENLKYLRILP